MKPIDFFIMACKARRYKEKAWVYSVFGCQLTDDQQLLNPVKYDVHRIDGIPFYVDENLELQNFEGFENVKDEPLLSFRDKMTVRPGDIPNCSEEIQTTVGNYFLNWYTIVHPFGTKLPFQTGEFSIKAILKQVRPLFVNNLTHPDGSVNYEGQDPHLIYVHEYVRFVQCMTAVAGFVEVSVPSATPYTMRTSPEVIKRRDELLEQHKDNLEDPTVIAEIEKELISLDKAWIDQDPDKGFYIKGKSFAVTRKKLHVMGGIEANFNGDGGYSLVSNSLMEGIELQNLTAQINSLRAGSYARGHLTALGGEAVKFFQRVLQNIRVVSGDCGVGFGIPREVTKENHGDLVGRYQVVGGEAVLIEDTKALIGKTIELRSPQACAADHTDYCEICMGKVVAASPTGVSAMGSGVGSVFMNAMMQATHGTALSVSDWDTSLLS